MKGFLLFLLFMGAIGHTDEGPLCYISGTGGRAGDPVENGFASVPSMIRLRFEVADFTECQTQVLGYCERRITQGYRFDKINGIFKGPKDKNERKFSVTKSCVFVPLAR